MSDMTVARTIADQIGGRAFFMMGAKDLAGWESGLHWRIGRNARGVSHVRVTLDHGSDTYEVEFLNIRAGRREPIKTLSTHEGIYCDMLHGLIERETGLYLSL